MIRSVLLWLLLASPAWAQWTVISNCTVVANASNDADSFHLKNPEGYEFTFRLYFVDAPETSNDSQLAKRVSEQAAHFGIDEQEVLKWGKTAASQVAERMKGKKLIVHTRWQIAPGRGTVARNYAFVEVGPGLDLAKWLVADGLARVHGVGEVHPPGLPEAVARERLVAIEADAKKNKRGMWRK